MVPRLDLWVLCSVGAVFSTLLVAVREVLDGTVRSLGAVFGCCETVREVVVATVGPCAMHSGANVLGE